MARPPQFSEKAARATRERVKSELRALPCIDRAYILLWLATHYNDAGARFDRDVGERRRRVTIDDLEYLLLRRVIPARDP